MINNNNLASTTYSATFNGSSLKRIRTPHPHDVLSGRGGGINGHVGNVQFREWVRVRKNDYNLAQSKVAKAQVAKEVIALVLNQNPPGRFLSKDPSSVGSQGWWIELDEEKIMAKTSQALREGAPQIRAAHREEIEELRNKTGRRSRKNSGAKASSQHSSTKRSFNDTTAEYAPAEFAAESWDPEYLERQKAMQELRANAIAAQEAVALEDVGQDVREDEGEELAAVAAEEEAVRPEKRVRVDYNGVSVLPTDETPPLLPLQDPFHGPDDNVLLPPPADLPPPPRRFNEKSDGLTRTHSLALSEASLGDLDVEFVNPFEDESDLRSKDSFSFPLRPGAFTRETSQASDLGGLSALFHSESSRSAASGSSGVRSRNSIGNVSTRYDGDFGFPESDSLVESSLDYLPSNWWELETTLLPPIVPQ